VILSNIAYCPLDIPKINIDEKLLTLLVDKHNTGHHDNLWKCLPLMGRVNSQSDFQNSQAFEKAWEIRYDEQGVVLNNELVYDQLKSLFDHISSLPLIVTHAQILSQIADVGKHYDMKHEAKVFKDDYPEVNKFHEPAGYKILLNNFNVDSFYVAEKFGAKEMYIKLPEDTNTFVINEKTYPHGATKPPTPKFVVSIFGLIKTIEHKELVKQSYKKYSNFAITF